VQTISRDGGKRFRQHDLLNLPCIRQFSFKECLPTTDLIGTYQNDKRQRESTDYIQKRAVTEDQRPKYRSGHFVFDVPGPGVQERNQEKRGKGENDRGPFTRQHKWNQKKPCCAITSSYITNKNRWKNAQIQGGRQPKYENSLFD